MKMNETNVWFGIITLGIVLSFVFNFFDFKWEWAKKLRLEWKSDKEVEK